MVTRLKFTLVLIVSIFYIISINAQNWFIGGDISITSEDRDNQNDTSSGFELNDVTNFDRSQKQLNINIRPTIGYNLGKSDIGFYPIINIIKNDEKQINETDLVNPTLLTYSIETKGYGLGGGIFYRYLFIDIGKFHILGRVDLSYQYTTLESEAVNNNAYPQFTTVKNSCFNAKSHYVSLILSPVFEYHISKSFSLFTDLNIKGLRCFWEKANQTQSIETETYYQDGSYTINDTEERNMKGKRFSISGSSITDLSITDTFSIGLIYRF